MERITWPHTKLSNPLKPDTIPVKGQINVSLLVGLCDLVASAVMILQMRKTILFGSILQSQNFFVLFNSSLITGVRIENI